MNGFFNGQILVDKLAKLNNSQQSIETLSHWCIFHRSKAKQVVEIWDRQFYCSPREQRISFLFLANDILQNSRRKGLEFINEFWKVLPHALADVFGSGDDFGRRTVLRLVDIWEERKVFGSRGQTLKEDILGSKLDNMDTNGKAKLKQSGEFLENIRSSYDHICDEDALFGKCQAAISIVDKVETELGSDIKSGRINGPEIARELQMQQDILGECIEQLKAAELSRATLISILKEALHEQEIKIGQVHSQLEVAELRFRQAGNISPAHDGKESLTEQRPVESSSASPDAAPGFESSSASPDAAPGFESSSAFSDAAPGFVPEPAASFDDQAQAALSRMAEEESITDGKSSLKEGEDRKTAAAMVASKLTASASSAQMLSFVLSSLATEGVIGQAKKEDYSPDTKRLKAQNSVPSQCVPPLLPLQPPMPPFPHPESLHHLPSSMTPGSAVVPPPPLPPRQPAACPSTMRFAQIAAGPPMGIPYSYGLPLHPPNYPMLGVHSSPSTQNQTLLSNAYQASPEGGHLLVQPPFPTMPPPLTRP